MADRDVDQLFDVRELEAVFMTNFIKIFVIYQSSLPVFGRGSWKQPLGRYKFTSLVFELIILNLIG